MKEVWIEKVNLALLLGAFAIGIAGLMQLSYSDEESETLRGCTLGVPFEFEYTYRLVGMRNYPGFLADQMWLNISYYGSSPQVIISNADPYFRDALKKAYENGFNLSAPVTPAEDKEIRLLITRDAQGCDEAKRRLYLSARIKDCLAYIGIAALMILSVYALSKTKPKS